MENKTFRNIFAIAICLAFLLVACAQPESPNSSARPAQAKRKNSSTLNATKSTASYSLKTEPLLTVQAYNAALTSKDIDRAAQFLANDVVFVDQRTTPCIHDVISGWHSAEAFLRNPVVLFSIASEYRVEGNRVSYELTEWLDPRIVGPNYPQPRKSHVIAVTEYGQIYALIMGANSDWLAIRNAWVGAEIAACEDGTHDS